jgi:cytochrome P450 family 724 subfamily B1
MVVLLVAFAAILLLLLVGAVVLRHFMPLLHNPGAPRGSFGCPLIGETLGFTRPHASTTTGAFLQDHIARYALLYSQADNPFIV